MSGHPGVVTGRGCPLCDGDCREGFTLPAVPANYPFLPAEMVAAMQPKTDEPTPAPEPKARGRRRAEDRMRRPSEDNAHHGSEDR